jgi:uncharacterized protein (UPF0333 family)
MKFLTTSLLLILIAPTAVSAQTVSKRNIIAPPQAIPAAQSPADERGTDSSPVVVKVLPQPPDEAKTAQEKGSAESEAVKAEQKTAHYTLYLAIGTFALAVISAFQIYFLIRTDRTARKSAEAAVRAAKAAEDSILKADDTARRELRAYIVVEPAGIEGFAENSEIIASVIVRNSGKIPARNIRWALDDDMHRDPLLGDAHFRIDDENVIPSTNLLGPGAQMRRFHKCTKLGDIVGFFSGDKCIYIWGKVFYKDGFSDNERYMRFCHRYESDCFTGCNGKSDRNERIRQHQYGNGTDED